MALVVNLRSVENLYGKADRVARVVFRGSAHQSRIVRRAKRVAYFGETFEWPLARSLERDEFLSIQILNHNKYLSNKVVAVYVLGLQQVAEDGQLKLTEPMVDLNNKILDTIITFEVNYYSPDGRVGRWGQEEFVYPLTDENLDNYENFDDGSWSDVNGMPALQPRETLIEVENGEETGGSVAEFSMTGEDTTSQTMILESLFKSSKKRLDHIEQELHKPKDFQICIRVIEGQQLAGLDIDPVIKIQVGDEHKYTAIKQSTNCPYYDEYFVFDFREAPATIFDKMITISAYHAYGIPGRNVFKAGNIIAGKRLIGMFKCDVATVYAAPNHMYYHKWALLMDSKDMGEGPKGYVKCDISVSGKGDVIKAPKGIKEEDTNDIDGNLLLPVGLSKNRESAVYSVNIYRAEDLPRTDYGIIASVRKAISKGSIALVDAYVKVSLAGHVGKTSVRKSYNPEWKESLKFVDKFPPLCNRIKVQLYDSDTVKDESIGTHFIELSQIMDPGGDGEGILPTFGPSWVNFYGAPRTYRILSEHDELNVGLGEGSAYRGRLLMSISTQIVKENIGKCQVIKEKLMRTGSLMENQPRKEFLLFATLFEATLIDKELRDKNIFFEISMGHYGNALDGSPNEISADDADQSSSDEDSDPSATLIRKRKEEEKKLICKSTTIPEKPLSTDKNYYYLPYGQNKQCLYLYSLYEDTKRRLYHSNILEKIADDLDEGLDEVKQMLKVEYDNTHQRLRGVLKTFESNCQNYISKADGPMLKGMQGIGRTDLDKYRLKMCKTKVDRMKSQAQGIKSKTSRSNVNQKFKEAKEIARKLKKLAKDPQHSLPDIFIWMISEKKRIAYYRIPAKDVIYSTNKDYTGKHCGHMQTVFLRKVGKKSIGPSGWVMQGKLNVYFWLGEKSMIKKKNYLENLPPGYDMVPSVYPDAPPDTIVYTEKQVFQLRAYLYQARSLIGSDDTGLSDPFARVILGNECKSTQYIDETLSPTWDETLIFSDITLYGPLTDVLANPPIVIAEIYDHDQVGQPEFLGRSIIKPKVKTMNEAYAAPEWPAQLEWHDVYRGPNHAGEILASFELIQVTGDEDLPPVPSTVQTARARIIPIPQEIKPILKMFRVEVLFWGIREPKRIQLLSVDRPRASLDIAGSTINSTMIANMEKNCNFDEPLKYIDVMLPENEMFWPPITIRVVDCRKFGRDVLVGTCTITHVQKYIWVPPEERERRQEELRKKKLLMLPIAERKRQEKLKELSDDERIELRLVSGALSQGVQFGVQNETSNGSIYSGQNVNSLKNGAISGNDSLSTAVNALEDSLAQLEVLSTHSNRMSTANAEVGPGSRRVSVVRPTSRSSATAPKHVTINMEGIEETPDVEFKSGMEQSTDPVAPTFTIPEPPAPASTQASIKEADKTKKKAAAKRRKELITDLDWWSKYYVTKEDIEKEFIKEQEQLKKIQSSEYEVASIDYENFDEKKIAQLRELHATDDSDEDTGKKKKKKKKKQKKKKKKKKRWINPKDAFQNMKGKINEAFQNDSLSDGEHIIDVDDVEEMEDKSIISRIKIYHHELEKVKEFSGFEEWVQNYDLFRGKKIDDEDNDFLRVSGRFKGTMCIYEMKDATSDGIDFDIENKPILKLREGLPNSKPVEIKVMIYIVRALDLHPVDANGKADPYLVVKCGRRETNDKDNRQNNQLNPVFGKLFEFDVVFPMDSILKIQVMDYDTLSADDLIGETMIDLENRFYSKHRARCGLQSKYEEYGYNIWRDPMKPTQILEKLCRDHQLSPPKYGQGCVHIGNQAFYCEDEVELESGEIRPSNEPLALEVLLNWDELVPDCPLVPEHLESRSLYIQEKPGVEQGKLEMWVDMFPKDMPQPSVTVDITPRLPKSYELRCIIWNTDDVVLEDTNMITGEASSDIFVKGYLKGIGEDDQSTDVHYRSLTGEGNFNWRFVFPFDYLKAEERIVYKTKGNIFDTTDTEVKVPAKLTLQVWDADIVSADDFLGYLMLDLNRIPRPFKDAKKCTEKWMKKMIARDSSVPTLNIFKCSKGCRGWWPMVAKQKEGGEDELVGKVEVELQLLLAEEAERNPAGLGRAEPNPLPEPNRPDTSFLWFMNPMRTCRYIICRNFLKIVVKVVVIVLLGYFIFLFFYSMPGYTVKKIFGV